MADQEVPPPPAEEERESNEGIPPPPPSSSSPSLSYTAAPPPPSSPSSPSCTPPPPSSSSPSCTPPRPSSSLSCTPPPPSSSSSSSLSLSSRPALPSRAPPPRPALPSRQPPPKPSEDDPKQVKKKLVMSEVNSQKRKSLRKVPKSSKRRSSSIEISKVAYLHEQKRLSTSMNRNSMLMGRFRQEEIYENSTTIITTTTTTTTTTTMTKNARIAMKVTNTSNYREKSAEYENKLNMIPKGQKSSMRLKHNRVASLYASPIPNRLTSPIIHRSSLPKNIPSAALFEHSKVGRDDDIDSLDGESSIRESSLRESSLNSCRASSNSFGGDDIYTRPRNHTSILRNQRRMNSIIIAGAMALNSPSFQFGKSLLSLKEEEEEEEEDEGEEEEEVEEKEKEEEKKKDFLKKMDQKKKQITKEKKKNEKGHEGTEKKKVRRVKFQDSRSRSKSYISDAARSELHLFELLNEFSQNLETSFSSNPLLDLHFPDKILQRMRHISSTVRQVAGYLSADLDELGLGDRSDANALINWIRLDWNFKNTEVDAYRQLTKCMDFSKIQYKEWSMPRYLDNTPLPNGSPNAIIHIDCYGSQNSLSLSILNGSPPTPLSANEAIETAVKYFEKKEHVSHYVLKVFGFCEYIYGDQVLDSFRFIRSYLRAQKKIQLVLIVKPSPSKSKLKSPTLQEHIAVLSDVNVAKLEVYELDCPFYVIIHKLDNCSSMTLPLLDNTMTHVFVTCFLMFGNTQLKGSVRMTGPAERSKAYWNIKLKGRGKLLYLKDLPRETKIVFLLNGTSGGTESQIIAYASRQLIDENGKLLQGRHEMNFWSITQEKMDTIQENISKRMAAIREQTAYEHKGNKRTMVWSDKGTEMIPLLFVSESTNRENLTKLPSTKLHFSLSSYKGVKKAPRIYPFVNPNPREVGLPLTPKQLHRENDFRKIINQDYLYHLTEKNKLFLWTIRASLVKMPRVLPLFLKSVNWIIPSHRHEAHRLLKKWKKPSPVIAMMLFSHIYPDTAVRDYAVDCIRQLTDSDLQLYLPQLVQSLKAEPYIKSALADFLVKRAIASPLQIGHFFFWHMKAELSDPMYCEKYALILELYLTNCPISAQRLRKQNNVVTKLAKAAENVVSRAKSGMSRDSNKKIYLKELKKLNKDFFRRMPGGRFELPLNPSTEVSTLIVEKCSFMSSKQAPLWLVFENADKGAAPVVLIFKSGDDLRQDILTLQLLKVMDRMWSQEGYDMRLTPYSVIATGTNSENKGMGMIEVVLDSNTVSGIQMKYGGGAGGAFVDTPIRDFIKVYNKSKDAYEKAIEIFMRSCAGYVIASSVLGLGDRHNGNIMVTKDGRLFHIDFGHFLGNFKSKMGIKRERVAFVFTPDMAFVLESGGVPKAYNNFLDLCCNGLNILRTLDNVVQLETLFLLMSSAGMPELQSEQDIFYMKGRLRLDLNPKKAKKWMNKEINKSKNSKWRQVDNWFHNKKHG